MACTYLHSFLESDDFYIKSSHILSIFQVPILIFGTFIITAKSPKAMGKVKFSMLLLHFSSAWFDIYITILSMPVFIFPITSGYALGLLYSLGVPSWLICYFGFTSLFLLGPPIIMSFENRYNHLIRQDGETKSRKIKRAIHYLFNYLISFTAFIPAFSNIVDPKEAQEIAKLTLPCLPSEVLENPRLVMLGTNLNIVVACLLAYVFICWSQIILFFSSTALYIFKTKSQSKRTSQLQKQFFKALCIQIAVPFIIIMIPAGYVIYSVSSGNLDMALANGSVLWMSTHGLFSTVIMLLVHKPYREAMMEVMRIKEVKKLTKMFNRSNNNSSVI